jgi:hypothetical protein
MLKRLQLGIPFFRHAKSAQDFQLSVDFEGWTRTINLRTREDETNWAENPLAEAKSTLARETFPPKD